MAHAESTVTVRPSAESVPAIWEGVKIGPLLATLAVGLGLWVAPAPEGMPVEAWHYFAIFAATIVGVIFRPLPVAPVVVAGVIASLLTQSATFDQMFFAFSQPSIWLICFSFFLAGGLIRTGLASRVAYNFMSLLGGTPLGMGYGMLVSELIIAPFVPSLSARSGGIFFPLAEAAARAQMRDGKVTNASRFLLMVAFQGSPICSAMFLTAMAGNPVMAQMVSGLGIEITWTNWALAAAVPGAVCLLALPVLLYVLLKPEAGVMTAAPQVARDKLSEMGRMTSQEWTMLGCFVSVLALWIVGPQFGIGNATAIMLGLVLLLCTGVLNWKQCLGTAGAWDTMLWLGLLIGMGAHLKELGFFDWFSSSMLSSVGHLPWGIGLTILAIVYFVSHYLFASNVGHMAAMYMAFVVAGMQLGAPPLLTALLFGFITNIIGGITHYASAPAPIYFSTEMFTVKEWWFVGGVVGFINLGIWLTVGWLWWAAIGLT